MTEIRIRRRSLFGRLIRFPGVWWQGYRIYVRHNGRWESARAAFLMTRAGLL